MGDAAKNRVYKPFLFWGTTPEGRANPQLKRMQLDTGADRTILKEVPKGAKIVGSDCMNRKPVHLVAIVASIPGTTCTAFIEAAVPKKAGALPAVIGADFFGEAKTIIDYRGEVVGCRPGPAFSKGFAGAGRIGVIRRTPGKCGIESRAKKRR